MVFTEIAFQVLETQTNQVLRSLAKICTQLHLELRHLESGSDLGERGRLDRRAMVLERKRGRKGG